MCQSGVVRILTLSKLLTVMSVPVHAQDAVHAMH
jgi:hypothetical protein